MNGWVIGGLACIIYMFVVGGLALRKSPGLIKLVKLKLSNKISDATAIRIALVMAGIFGLAGIIFFIFGVVQ